MISDAGIVDPLLLLNIAIHAHIPIKAEHINFHFLWPLDDRVHGMDYNVHLVPRLVLSMLIINR